MQEQVTITNRKYFPETELGKQIQIIWNDFLKN